MVRDPADDQPARDQIVRLLELVDVDVAGLRSWQLNDDGTIDVQGDGGGVVLLPHQWTPTTMCTRSAACVGRTRCPRRSACSD